MSPMLVKMVVTRLDRSGQLEQHVGGLAVEDIDATRQTVVPEAELYADIEVGVGLPR